MSLTVSRSLSGSWRLAFLPFINDNLGVGRRETKRSRFIFMVLLGWNTGKDERREGYRLES